MKPAFTNNSLLPMPLTLVWVENIFSLSPIDLHDSFPSTILRAMQPLVLHPGALQRTGRRAVGAAEGYHCKYRPASPCKQRVNRLQHPPIINSPFKWTVPGIHMTCVCVCARACVSCVCVCVYSRPYILGHVDSDVEFCGLVCSDCNAVVRPLFASLLKRTWRNIRQISLELLREPRNTFFTRAQSCRKPPVEKYEWPAGRWLFHVHVRVRRGGTSRWVFGLICMSLDQRQLGRTLQYLKGATKALCNCNPVINYHCAKVSRLQRNICTIAQQVCRKSSGLHTRWVFHSQQHVFIACYSHYCAAGVGVWQPGVGFQKGWKWRRGQWSTWTFNEFVSVFMFGPQMNKKKSTF